jgi:hypothetical protein
VREALEQALGFAGSELEGCLGDPLQSGTFLAAWGSGEIWVGLRLERRLIHKNLKAIIISISYDENWETVDPTLSAIDLGSLLSSSVDQPQNPQQTETF